MPSSIMALPDEKLVVPRQYRHVGLRRCEWTTGQKINYGYQFVSWTAQQNVVLFWKAGINANFLNAPSRLLIIPHLKSIILFPH